MKDKIIQYKSYIMFVAKIAFAVLLICYLVSNKKLDISLFRNVYFNYKMWMIFFAIHLVVMFLSVYRWKIILNSQPEDIPGFCPLLFFSWTGSFFATFLPGVIATDVSRFYYLNRYTKKVSGSSILSSLIVDRFLSLTGLLIIVLVSINSISQKIPGNSRINCPIIIMGILLLPIIVFAFLWNKKREFGEGERSTGLISSVQLYFTNYKMILIAVSLSVVTHLLKLLSFCMILYFCAISNFSFFIIMQLYQSNN